MVDNLRFAFKIMKKQPIRAFLTLLQLAIGFAAIVIVLTFVFNILTGINSLEDAEIYKGAYEYYYGVSRASGRNGNYTSELISFEHIIEEIFSKDMINKFRESNYINNLTIVEKSSNGMLEWDGMWYLYEKMYGTGVDFRNILDLKMVKGNFFNQVDINNSRDIIVISEIAAQKLFGDNKAVGQIVNRVENGRPTQSLEVIGIYSLENKPHLAEAGIHYIMPYTAIQGYDKGKYEEIWINFKEGRAIEGQENLRLILFSIPDVQLPYGPEKKKFFQFKKLFSEDIETTRKITFRFGLFIGSFAFIAIVISFIGVFSIMLISVLERTREIGLRRSLGATRKNIMSQILTESVLFSFIGGLFGIVLAICSVNYVIEKLIFNLFQQFSVVSSSLSITSLLIALGGILVVGLGAGLYPAIQASKMAPVEALQDLNN